MSDRDPHLRPDGTFDDLGAMKDVSSWGIKDGVGNSMLPLKRYGEKGKPPACAMMMHFATGEHAGFHFVNAGMFETPDPSKMKRSSPDEIFADGWKVD